MEEFICRVCGNNSYKEIGRICVCTNCGIVFSDPIKWSLSYIKIKKLDNNARLPQRMTEGSVGYDICSAEDICIPVYDNENKKVYKVKTGLSVELPDNTEMQIRARSGLGKRNILITNGVGTIDFDYRGELMLMFVNLGNEDFYIKKGDRIAQALITTKLPYRMIETTDDLGNTKRGSGGFGHTGK